MYCGATGSPPGQNTVQREASAASCGLPVSTVAPSGISRSAARSAATCGPPP